MARKMTDFKEKDYGTLLANNKIDASKGILFGATGEGRLPPNTHHRTILIGLGGTGVRTINHIKRTISRKLDPTWKQYIAFLAIDSDLNEIDQATDLSRAEAVETTLKEVGQRAVDVTRYPMPWRVFADANKVSHLSAVDGNGCGRTRLMGKMKIHDQMPGAKGVDEQIVDSLSRTRSELLPTSGNAFYEVYVIGSVSGGTCSGGFLELPALVRRALNVNNIHVHAMLYLPDTVSELDSQWKNELEANGYASLKELNYYQGLDMRKGYREEWTYNSPAERKLSINSEQDFFEIPYLIGTIAGPAKDSLDVAMDTIANFFVNILGDVQVSSGQAFLMDSFLSNAHQHRKDKHASQGNPELEAAGELHDFPKRYGAIGFAEAAAPEEIIRAYAVSRACVTAGLQSVDTATRASLVAKGAEILPFLGEKEFLPAGEGTNKAFALLKPLQVFLDESQQENFNFLQFMGLQNVMWEDLKKNVYENVNVQIGRYIESKTNEAAKAALDNRLLGAFTRFKAGIQEFVVNYGPLAFYNLYMGNFIPENNNGGVGLKQMLANICADKDPRNGMPINRTSAADAERAVQAAKKHADDLKGIITLLDITGERQNRANAWLQAKNRWVSAAVNEKRREYLLGTYHAFDKKVQEPTAILADELRAFGYILDKLSDTYKNHGAKLNTFEDFSTVSDYATEVNIAALNTSAHAWLKEESERIAGTIQGKKVRTALVDSFFKDSSKWLEIPEGMVKTTDAGAVILTNPDVAVPARQEFDACMQESINLSMDVSIEKLFKQVNQRDVDYKQYARQVINALTLKSKLLFNGNIDENLIYRYIMYPSVLNTSDPAIVAALQEAAQGLVAPGNFYASTYADSIAMYQLAAPFEIYHLHDLEKWEKQYDEKMSRISGLHGRSPDLKQHTDAMGTVSFEELTSWYDYPAISFKKDPTKKDPQTGERCHEGDVRLEIDKMLETARKLGVLYSKETSPDKWSYYRVYCDKSRDWEFDETLVRPDKETGLLPTGVKLVEAVAAQNGSSVAELSRCVELHNGGLLNEPHSKDWAWIYAKRVLYVHRPMLIEIRDTIEKFAKWNEQVEAYNESLRRKWMPAKMIRMMQGHVLFSDGEGFWSLEDSDNVVTNLSEAGLRSLGRRSPKEAALVENGFVLFYLYNALMRRKEIQDGGMDKLLEQANQAITAWGDPELLDACFDLVDKMMREEISKLEKLGGSVDDPTKKPLQKYVAKMDELGLNDYVTSICEFYAMAKLWKRVC